MRALIYSLTRILMGISLVFSIGCASRQNYINQLEDYKGKPVAKLIEEQGPPTSQFRAADGTQTIQYQKKRDTEIYGYDVTYRCDTVFVIDQKEIVQNYRYSGNDCEL